MKRDGKHCRRGHLLTEETSRYRLEGWRVCRICESLARRRAYLRAKGSAGTYKGKWAEFREDTSGGEEG